MTSKLNIHRILRKHFNLLYADKFNPQWAHQLSYRSFHTHTHTHYRFYFNIYQSMHCWNRWRYNSIGEEYRVFVCLVGGISEIDINYALHVPIQLCTTILMPQSYECTFRYEWWHPIIAEIDDVHAINACLCIRRKITMLLNTFSIGCGLSSHAIRNDEDNFN